VGQNPSRPTETAVARTPDGKGRFRPDNRLWYLRNTHANAPVTKPPTSVVFCGGKREVPAVFAAAVPATQDDVLFSRTIQPEVAWTGPMG